MGKGSNEKRMASCGICSIDWLFCGKPLNLCVSIQKMRVTLGPLLSQGYLDA